MQFGTRAGDVLPDPGWHHPPLPRFKRNLATLGGRILAGKQVEGRCPGGRWGGKKIMQPHLCSNDFRRGAAHPHSQSLVYKTETSVAIGRIKPDRCVVEQVEE